MATVAPNGEPVELVTDFAQLRPGVVVWALACRWCGGDHRAILVDYDPAMMMRTSNGEVVVEPAYRMLPLPPCHDPGISRWVSDYCVRHGTVHRVVDPLLDRVVEDEVVVKPKKKERAR